MSENDESPLTPSSGGIGNHLTFPDPRPSLRRQTEQRIATLLARTTRSKFEKTMKTRSLLILAGLAISFVLPSFAQQKDAVDPKVEQQIRALAQKYDDAIAIALL
jgi:hypothetical protein